MDNKQTFIINVLYYGLILFFTYLALKYLLPVLLPFFIAFVIVWLIRRPADYVSGRWSLNDKKWLRILFLTLFYGLLGWLIVWAGSGVIPAAANLIVQLPALYTQQILPWLEEAYAQASLFFREASADMALEMGELYQQGLTRVGDFLSDAAGAFVRAVPGYAASVPSAFIRIVITVIASYFMAADYERLAGFFAALLPPKYRKGIVQVMEQARNVVVVFFRSYSLLMLLTFAELCIGFWILGIPYGGLIAAVIAVFDILPILGTGGALIPWAIIAALAGEYEMALGILLLYLVITVIRNSLEPRLVGKQIGLHPLITLMSMFVGAGLFGVAGLFGFPLALSILTRMKNEAGQKPH